MSWGIELPFDSKYVTYVWFDALLNYISVPGYGGDQQKFDKWWPATVQLIGKDILTTHCVYWPTMLFALGLPLPKTIFAHGWWLTDKNKMSKSMGNIVDPLSLIDEYGVDPVRYYLMREMVLGQDANFSLELFVKRYNSDLANDFGNLLNRVSGLIDKYFKRAVPSCDSMTKEDKEIKEMASSLESRVDGLILDLKMNEAIEEVLSLIRAVNKYLENQAPWKIAKDDISRAGTILYVATEALRISTVQLMPVMPRKCETVFDVLSVKGAVPAWGGLKAGSIIKEHEALFPRLDLPKD